MANASVAIIGIGCRAKDISTPEQLLDAVGRGGARFSPLGPDRWDAATFGPAPLVRTLDDYEVDFRAFRIPPAQLARMHRMERAALAALRSALIDAGLGEAGPWGERTAVHMAATTLGLDPSVDHLARVRLHETQLALTAALGDGVPPAVFEAARRALDAAAPPISVDSLMTTAAMTAGRLANAFDLGGGHCSHDVGAASGLAAVAAAVASLEAGECDVAVVGAVSPLLTTTIVEAHRLRRLLTASDHVGGPGTAPSGTLLGEGAFALVLVREADARVDGRRIRAIIRGVGQGSVGRLSVSAGAEAAMIRASRQALASSRFSAASVDYVECQAAGFSVVDGAEQRALARVFAEADRRRGLSTASCVPALGFLGAATGLASLATAALALERGERPGEASRDYEVEVEQGVLPAHTGPQRAVRRAFVSSPGFGPVTFQVALARQDDRAPRSSSIPRAATTDRRVAIVGMGVVVPGAPDVARYWRGILEGMDAVGAIPRERWDVAAFSRAASEGVPGAVSSTLAGLLGPVVADPMRLRVPPVSARYMDGAVTLAVDACAQALEDAGYRGGVWDPERVGVIIGHLPLRDAEFRAERRALAARSRAVLAQVLTKEGVEPKARARCLAAFHEHLVADLPPLSEDTLEAMSSLACATRVATLYDFRGGAQTVDAACASSLVALKLGVGALERGELDAVVVGATAYNLFPEYFVALATLGALATAGSWPFDVAGNGMVPAEGAAAVVLRRASDAARDRSRIYAIVSSVGCSSDGRGSALLAPSTRGQQRALVRAYAAAQLQPETIDLLEAHGTGTRAGDAVEVETYGAVFGGRDRARPIAVGSVKSNIGHLSSAAGMAGLIKTALALHHRVLPPMRHSGQLHPDHHALHGGALTISHEAAPWPEPHGGVARRAGVSAFGLGGINAHVVLEEHVVAERRARRAQAPLAERRARRMRIELVPVARPVAPAVDRAGGTTLLLGDPDAELCRSLRARLEDAGLRVLSWNPPARGTAAEIEARVRSLEVPGLVGVIDAVDLGAAASGASGLVALDAVRRAVGVCRALYPRWEGLAPGQGFYVALTAMGGGLGLLEGRHVSSGGAHTGFAKGLKHELPSVFVRVIDLDPGEEVAWLADTVAAELALGGDRVEVCYFTRRRLVPTLRAEPRLPVAAPPILALGTGDVVVFSGGGRGVVFACARALAQRGVTCVLTGRTPRPSGDEPWVDLDEEAFEALRRREMIERRRKDPTLTPVAFARAWAGLVHARELGRNLASVGDAPIEYVECDVTDAAACARLVADVRTRHGRVDGVVHGAMIEQSRALPDKQLAIVDATVRAKVTGLGNLIEATRPDALRFFAAFGSIAGRLGNAGQADYCAANDAMAKVLARYAEERPTTRCVTIDWTAWSDVGAAASPRTAELLRQAGVTTISPDEGSAWFVEELTHGPIGLHEVVICSEQQALAWPYAGRVSDSHGAAPTELDDRGQPLQPADWPLCDTALAAKDRARLVVERTFDPARDRYLAEHKLDDVPILPGAFAVELLAEAAALASGGLDVREVHGFVIDAPLRLARGVPQLLRTEARAAEHDAAEVRYEVRTAVDLVVGGATLQRDRSHYHAQVVLGAPRPYADAPGSGPATQGVPSYFDAHATPIALGPTFRLVGSIARDAGGATGIVRAPDESALFAFTTMPRFLVDPLLLDAAFQVASNHGALGPDAVIAIPIGFDSLILHARRPPNTPCVVVARAAGEQGDDVLYDVVVRAGETLLFELDRLRLRRLARG